MPTYSPHSAAIAASTYPINGARRSALGALLDERLQRAIGVLYLPRTERRCHYFSARLADQFDAVIHFDVTDAVQPLEPASDWNTGEAPETYPIGL